MSVHAWERTWEHSWAVRVYIHVVRHRVPEVGCYLLFLSWDPRIGEEVGLALVKGMVVKCSLLSVQEQNWLLQAHS